ncbi:hypothetical protein M3Y98_00832900 [Aphelenchoides besseyi]|nr:hypothetical protein M3Y98_00832900 [Aphelenchoides besseyi]KAI6195437.1 hypothetical protein M3Y96_01231300 [Aphelenchoides besseyi]
MTYDNNYFANNWNPCGNPDNVFANCDLEIRYHELLQTLIISAVSATFITCLLSLLSLSSSGSSGCLDFVRSPGKAKSKCDQKKSIGSKRNVSTARSRKDARSAKNMTTSNNAPSSVRVSARSKRRAS